MQELTNVQKLEIQRKEKLENEARDIKLFSYDKLSEMTGLANDMIAVIHKTVAKGTTNPELAYFLNYSKSIGLNPLNKEIWCYKNTQGDVIIFTGRDGFLKKNKENKDYRGMRSSEVRENDIFSIDMIEGKVEHKFGIKDRGNIIGAYAIVSIKGQKDVIKWVEFSEFDKKQAEWKTKPAIMIKKVAESHALREAAGLTGIQPEESFIVKDNVAYANVVEEKIEPEKERLLKMIDNSKSIEALEKLKTHCEEPDLILAYENKRKELDNQK